MMRRHDASAPRKKILAAAAIAGCLALLATGCTSSNNSSTTSTGTGGTLRIALVGAPTTLDPAQGSTPLLNMLAYEPLITINDQGEFAPGLAESWKYLDGNQHQEFQLTLRQGAKFSDGTPVTAAAVQNWLEYFVKSNGPFASTIGGSGTTISAPNDHTVVLKLQSPNPGLPYALAQTNGAGYVAATAGLSGGSLAKSTYGAGEYVYQQSGSVAGDTYVYTPNKYYFDQKNIHWKKVVVKVVQSPTSAQQGIASGQFDAGNGSIGTIDAARSANINVITSQSDWDGIGLLNRAPGDNNPFANVKVRQALNYAVDRQTLLKGILNGNGIATSAWITLDGADPASQKMYSYDPKKAKELLKEAGYPNGVTLKMIAATGPLLTGTPSDTLSQALAQQMQSAGITLDTTFAPGPQFNTDLFSGKYDGVLYSFGFGQYALYYTIFINEQATLNLGRVTDPKLETLSQQLLTSNDPGSISRQITKYVTEQAFNVPLFAPDTVYLASKNIANVRFPQSSDGLGLGFINPNPTEWTPAK